MNSFEQIVYQIVENYNKNTDYTFIQRIKSLVSGNFATILTQEYQKTGKISKDCMSTIQIDMEKSDENDTYFLGLNTDVIKLYKTKIRIPQPLKLKTGNSFSYVGTTDNSEAFAKIDPEYIKYILQTKFQKCNSYYSFINNYIYTYNSANKKINIRYIPADLQELNELQNSQKETCNVEINIPLDTARLIRSMIYQELNPLENPELKISEVNDN